MTLVGGVGDKDLETLFTALQLDQQYDFELVAPLDFEGPELPGEDKSRYVYQKNLKTVFIILCGDRASGLANFKETLEILKSHKVALSYEIFYSFFQVISHLWPIPGSEPKVESISKEFHCYFSQVQYTDFLADCDYALALKLYLLYANYLLHMRKVSQTETALSDLKTLYESPICRGKEVFQEKGKCYQMLALCKKMRSDFEGAKVYLEKAIASQCQSDEKAHTYDLMAQVLIKLGAFTKAKTFALKALRYKKNHPTIGRLSYYESCKTFGFVLIGLGKLEKALSFFTAVSKGNKNDFEALFGIAEVYKAYGLFTRASQQYKEVCDKILSQKGILFFDDSLLLLQCRAESFRLQGKYHEAFVPFTALSGLCPLNTEVSCSIADIYQNIGGYNSAIERCSAARCIHENLFGNNHYFSGSFFEKMGLCFAYKGKYTEAFTCLQKSLDARLTHLGPDHVDTASSYDALGKFYELIQNDAQAKEFYKKAYAIRKTVGEKNELLLDLSKSLIDNQHMLSQVDPRSSYKLTKEEFHDLIQYARLQVKAQKAEDIVLESNPTGFVRLRLQVPEKYREKIEVLRINFWAPSLTCTVVEAPHNHPRYFESMILKGGYTHITYEPMRGAQEATHVVNRIFKSNNEGRNITPLLARSLSCLGPQSFSQGAHIAFPLSVIHQVTNTIIGTMSINCILKDTRNCDYYDVFMPIESAQDPQVERIDIHEEDKKEILGQIEKNLDEWVASQTKSP